MNRILFLLNFLTAITAAANIPEPDVALCGHVLRSPLDTTKGFTPLKIGVSATDSKTTFIDDSASGAGPYFDRILVEP